MVVDCNMKRKSFVIAALLLFGLQNACTVLKGSSSQDSSVNLNATPPKDQSFDPRTVEDQLVHAAQSIEQSLGVLAAAEQAESPPILDTEPLTTPEGGMGGKVDLEWTGPLAPLVQKIANLSHYRVKFLGKEPVIPVLISISAKAAVMADVLQNASLQAGKRAYILVFPTEKVIEVRYLQ